MAQDDIQGTVTDSAGDPVQGAVVALIPNDGSNGDDVLYTTTDSNGDYIFDGHPQGDGTTQEWHVMARFDDGSGQFNSLSLPYVSADLPEQAVIPDSEGLHEWLINEGSGSTATDRVGSADLSLSSPTWQGGVGVDDYVLSFDGTDDEAVASEADLQDYGDNGGVMLQVNIPSEPTERNTLFRENYVDDRLYFFLIDSEGDDLSVGLGDTANDASHGLDFGDWSFGNWTGVALFWDSGNYDLHLYDFPSESITSGSANYSGSVNLEGDLGFMFDISAGGRHVDGEFDFPRLYGDYKSPSEVQSRFEEIADFYK